MILTVTYNPAVDQTMALDEPLESGVVNRASDARFDAGGKGINVSQILDSLGSETVATGLLGGFTGQFVADRLDDEGISSDFVPLDEPTRLNTTVLAADGEYKLNQNGPNVGASAVDDLVERITTHDPERVLVAGSLPAGLDTDAIDRIARSGDWNPVVDVGGDLLRELTADYALCKPNRSELADATGLEVDSLEACAEAAARLRREGFERVVASLGGDGALLAGPEGVVHAAPLDVDVVDTVGAGDSLLAGVLAAFDRGEGDELAVATGVSVASRVVAQAGTGVPELDGMPENRTDVETGWIST